MNTLSEDEYKRRLFALMPELIKRGRAKDRLQLDELFFLHNDKFTPFETGKHCSGCKSRVFKKMRDYYNSLTNG